MIIRRANILCTAVLTLVALCCVQAAEPERTWNSADGKTLVASLVSANKTSVTLRLEGGREAIVPLERLSQNDRDYLSRLKTQGLTFAVGEMPEETQTPRQIDVEGGPRVFRTPHFEFETDQNVSKAFISEAARVYEGTYLALQSLPLGLKLTPPEGKERYRGLFMNDQNFNAQLGDSVPVLAGQKVAGVYIPNRKELLVPYSSMGAKRSGSQVTLRRSSDTSTLIHEITHQVMHDWLPFIPVWMAEGLSEYISSVPYQNGRFEFKNAEAGLKERLEEKYRDGDGVIQMTRPSRLIARSIPGLQSGKNTSASTSGLPAEASRSPKPSSSPGDAEWGGALSEYRDAMLLIYYFIHLDRPDAPGAPVAAYLKLVDQAKTETDTFISEFNAKVDEFEVERKGYNEEVRRFNEELETYRAAVNSYNSKVTELNQQILEGVPETDWVDTGSPPAEPVPPKALVIPDILKNSDKTGGQIDIVALVRERANGALLRDRTGQALDKAVQDAFAGIGITIRMER